jgi:uncharacterized membrane-anchored protein
MNSSGLHHHAMSLPHRRPAYGVNPPALFRHVGFRIEDPDENPLTAGSAEEADKRRRRLVARLNASLAALQQRFGTAECLSIATTDEDAGETAIPITNTLLNVLEKLPESLEGWRARLRVDIHSEYYFVTLILDQKSGHPSVAKIGNSERELTVRGCAAIDTQSFIREYYDEVWSTLDQFANTFAGFPGDRFTEFRSIALRDVNSPFVRDREREPEKFTIPPIDSAEFDAARQSMREWLRKNARCIQEILQFEQFIQKGDQDANCVLCEMLDGAAIYGSSVRQVPAGVRSADAVGVQPLRYLLLYNGLSKYQLGRLVRRTHVMGELRVAAALDSRLLDQASLRLRALGNKIDTFLEEPEDEVTLSDSEIDSVLQELNKISSLVPGGLMYRINRSRYYAKAFRDRISDMRVKRLEGWQAYDEFFERNLYQVFDDIDQIGIRYEALAERINRLIVARNADRLRRSQRNIQELVHEMTAADRTIARIQQLGEWIGFVAVTYYGGHIIAEVLHQLCGGQHHMAGFLIAAIIALGFGYFWHRSYRHEEKRTAGTS